MEKRVYEELDELKSQNEKLRVECRSKSELIDGLKKVQSKQSVEIEEARSVIENLGFQIEEKTSQVCELNRTNEDLQRCLREKDSVLKRLSEANDKVRADGEEKEKGFEEERRKLVLALDEASERGIDLEQRNNVYRAEIEGLKGVVAEAEKKKMEAEKALKGLREMKGRDDVVVKMEEEKIRVEEKLKWKKEQFKHLEEAYEKLQSLFEGSKKEWEEERTTLLDEIYSLQGKLDSKSRICEDLEKRLQMCNSALSQEETRRKHLEVQVSEFKARYEDAFAEFQDARTRLDDLGRRRDEEVAELRQSLTTKETYFKEMKYEKGRLEQENRELLSSLKELQEATIQGSGNSALTKLKHKFRNLESIHKNCSANLRSRESEWSSQMEKMAEEISDYEVKLRSKEAALKEVELELENSRSSIAKMCLEYEEISVMCLVLSRTVYENQTRVENVEDEKSYAVLIEQIEQKNGSLAKAQIEIEEEREKVASLLKRMESLDLIEEENRQMRKEVERYKETLEESSKLQTQMKQKMEEAERDYEEKLLQVCDALDNTNSDLVAEREKAVGLTRKVESFGAVKEKETRKYKEMLEESENCRALLQDQISQLENDSKKNTRDLCSKVDTAYAKLAEEVEKNTSLVKSIELAEEHREKELEKYKEMLKEATKSQLLLQEKHAEVSEALETANSELSDKTSEGFQLEFQLWVWKCIAKRLKVELEENQNLRKRVEASLIEQVGVGEAMKEERDKLLHKLNAMSSKSETENVALVERLRDKEMVLEEVQREVELLEEEVLRRELEDAVFAHTEIEILFKRRNESESLLKSVSLLLEQKQEEANVVYKAWEKLSASMILTEVETEAKRLMIIELESEISSINRKLDSSDESASKSRAELETKQRELKEVTSLSSERGNLLIELEKGMSKMCDEDTKLMKALEKATRCCDDGDDDYGKENMKLLVMKQEDVVGEEERSPFRQLNC